LVGLFSARVRSASAWVLGSWARKAVLLFGLAKLKALVRSPHTARRQAEMLGSITPKRCSRKRSTEVWSNTCELTQPPLLNGDTTYIGTRAPRP